MRMRKLGFAAAVFLLAACTEARESTTSPEALVVPVFAHTSHGDANNLGTHLTGSEEVPSNDSRAQGQAIFQLSKDGGELHYKLIVANIHNVLQAHIHLAPSGVNGPIVVWLYPSGPPAQLIPGRVQGVLAQGVITDANVIGLLAGAGVEGLLEQIRAGNTYVNVHTTQLPPGEIRGQLD